MAYFEHNDTQRVQPQQQGYTRRFSVQEPDAGGYTDPEDIYDEDAEYDDGFDDLNDEDTDQDDGLTEDERREETRMKYRFAANMGNLVAVIFGTAVILVLIALLISMLNFLFSDISQSFSLWSTKF